MEVRSQLPSLRLRHSTHRLMLWEVRKGVQSFAWTIMPHPQTESIRKLSALIPRAISKLICSTEVSLVLRNLTGSRSLGQIMSYDTSSKLDTTVIR